MATKDWLQTAFTSGYDSGDILAAVPDSVRLRQEALIGGSYREAFYRAVLPFLRPDSTVLEVGPGRGSWTRALLAHLPEGRVETVDFQDVTEWLVPQRYGGRLVCHQATDLSLDCVADGAFDVFFSFGVLCHHTIEQIGQILTAARAKVRRGGVGIHEYGDWHKMFRSGRMAHFPDLVATSDEESWWPSNSAAAMAACAEAAGWLVIEADLGLFERDGMILLKAW